MHRRRSPLKLVALQELKAVVYSGLWAWFVCRCCSCLRPFAACLGSHTQIGPQGPCSILPNPKYIPPSQRNPKSMKPGGPSPACGSHEVMDLQMPCLWGTGHGALCFSSLPGRRRTCAHAVPQPSAYARRLQRMYSRLCTARVWDPFKVVGNYR